MLVEATLKTSPFRETEGIVQSVGPAAWFGIPVESEFFDDELDAEIEKLITEPSGEARSPLPFPVFPTPAQELSPASFPGSVQNAPGQASPLIKYQLWLAATYGSSLSSPAAPHVRGVANSCEVQLIIQDFADNEAGIRLYHLGPNDSAFGMIADFQAFPSTGAFFYIHQDRSVGKHLYYAASYNASGETLGNIFSVEVLDEACSAYNPVGVSFQGATLTTGQQVDKLYCYASVNDAAWKRIPFNAAEFIYPENSLFDLSPFLQNLISPPHYPLKISLECWGWAGDTLIDLGIGSQTLYEGSATIESTAYAISGIVQNEPVSPEEYSLKRNSLAPPYYLHYPDSLADCNVHADSNASLRWACESMIDLWGKPTSPNTLLVWYWNEHDNCNAGENYCGYNVSLSDVKGFHVYRQTPGSEPVLVETVLPNTISMAVLTPGQTGSAAVGTRYFVRAFMEDGFESGDSNYLEARTPQYRVTIPAGYSDELALRVYKANGKIVEVFIGADPSNPGDPPEYGIDFGYMRHHSSSGLPRSTSMYENSFLSFDLDDIPGTITSARLHWDGEISTSGPGNNLWADRCYNRLTDFFGQKVGYAPMILLSMDEDVTNQALAWQKSEAFLLSPLDYFGFWLLSGVQTLAYTDYDFDMCMVRIKNVHLEVEYVK